MPLAPGTPLGPYDVLAPLGAGGTGEVYKARDTRLDRTVALKVLPADIATDPILRQRRRARLARSRASITRTSVRRTTSGTRTASISW